MPTNKYPWLVFLDHFAQIFHNVQIIRIYDQCLRKMIIGYAVKTYCYLRK
jgi:hypothetical protein